MNIEGTRRVLETTSSETANEYLRFGWKLINQYIVPPTLDSGPIATFVLASVRTLEDTKQVITLERTEQVNEYLDAGWKLIEKYVTSAVENGREESVHFVLAWQDAETPAHPGQAPSRGAATELFPDALQE